MSSRIQINRCILYLFLFLLSSAPARAGKDPVIVSVLRGSNGQLQAGQSALSVDLAYYANPENIERTYRIDNVVSFGIDENSAYQVQSAFSATANIRLIYRDSAANEYTKDTALTVEYTDAGSYRQMAYMTFQNAYRVEVQLQSMTTTANWDAVKVLQLRNELTATRDYVFSCSQSFAAFAYTTPGTGADELRVNWSDPQAGQTEYDLEWAWVDASAIDRFKDASGNLVYEQLFANNASRVTLQALEYKVPLLYDGSGTLYFRIRAAQVKEDKSRYEGNWWYGSGSTILAYTFTGHENDLNWQATTTFAEEGKRKSVVQYFDGTLRGRQTVTKDNVTQNTVVAETFYDYQGRPVIQVLPAPTVNQIMGYTANFNKAISYAGYPKSIYDEINGTESVCAKPAAALATTDGASNYYSPNNPDNSRAAAFIPDAEGYPLTETRYTDDGTGRIAAQGGVGPTYQMGSGHETKYFYEAVSQRELDALFGTDAGYASHYSKNIVKDANGQYSISYVDMRGKTVATALAGTAPVNLQQLSSYSSTSFTKELLDAETNNVTGTSIVSSKPLLIMKEDDYAFHYQLSPEQLSLLNCNQVAVCYDCLYDLTITVTAECDNVSSTNFTSSYTFTRRNFTLGDYANDCAANGKSPAFDASFSLRLPEGAYTVTKTLTLHKPAADAYQAVYLANNTCKTLQQFIDIEHNILFAQSNCAITCTSCKESIGTFAQFRDRFTIASGMTTTEVMDLLPQLQQAYNEALDNCNRICNENTDDGFEEIRSIRKAMLMDVTPKTGQYARTDAASLNRRYNIFSTTDNNMLNGSPYEMYYTPSPDWKFPLGLNSSQNLAGSEYKDEYGATDPVNTGIVTGTVTATDFADNFKPSWAEALLPHHPEYGKLYQAEQFLKSSYQFEANLNNTITQWSQAGSQGYLASALALLNADPFFASVPNTAAYKTLMTAKINSYVTAGSVTYSMWQLAASAAFCRNITDPQAQITCVGAQPLNPSALNGTGCATDRDQVWQIFAGLYLSERKKMLANWLGDRCPNIKLADILSFNGPTETIYTPRFSTYDLNGMGGDLQTVLNHLTDEAAATGAVANVMATQYQATCEAYATQWIATLKECDAIAAVLSAADEADLKRRLIGICVLGSDENHLMGSSSVKPGSVYIDPANPASSYSNFPQVIKEYLQSKSIPVSATCHPYLIEAPKPYEKAIPATVQQVISKPDQCQCTQINKVYREYQRLNYAGTFSNYLENAYQTYMSQADLEKLLSLCNDTYPCAFLTEPIGLPPVLQCFSNGNGTSAATTACIECTEYFTIKQQFTTETGLTGPVANPQTTAEEQANMAFQQYANYHTGFSKLWTEYLAFENVCNNNVIPCGTLSSLLQQYYTTYGTAFTDESQCRAQFTTFFNNQLQTSFSFDELMSLFRNCGDVPEVCRPVVTCESFKTLLDGFYDMYGMPDAMSGNCEQNFTNYFNLKFNRNYTYAQIQALYNQACGCTLDVCTQLNCFLLTRAYTKFRNSYNQIVLPGTNCQDAFTSFFNDYFSTTGMTYPAIYELYEACYDNQCGPNPATICQPVQTCAHIQLLITDFNNTHPPGTLESSDCLSLFTAYYNQQMGTTYSYADIAALITQLCGSVNICQPRESCETYAVVLANYAYNASSGLTCEDHFTSYFNQYFQTSYTYSAIVSLYQQCGFDLQVCNNPGSGGGGGGVVITDCAQLQAVVQNFLSIYPAPANQFGSHCMEKFALYFNTVFHQAYSENDIRNLYQQLCGQPLNICDVNDCNNYRVFTDRFNQVYYTIPVPNNLKQELYTRQFNQQFFEPGLYTYSELKPIVGFCTVTDDPDPPGQGPVRRNLNQLQLSEYDPAVLRGFKAVYLQMHPQESAETCPDLFTSNFNYYLVREYTYDSLMHLYDAVCGPGSGYICAPLLAGRNQGTVTVLSGSELPAGYAFSPKLCGGSEPVFPPGPPVTTDPCKDLEKIAVAAGEDRYTRYIDSLKNVFELAYRQKCLAAKDLESLTVTGAVSEYHYTLYYYDQSGSLVRTVPPAGVDARHGDATFLAGVAAKRADARLNGPLATNYLVPAHRLVTAYCYNSLNQVTAQQTPDAGLSRFWYDRLGRLAVSQNAQQYIDNRFSYTRYDVLGRITEVGQQRQPSGSMSQAVSQSESALTSWLNGGTGHEQMTRTVYDAPYEAPYDFLCPQYLCQQNLRNRVSYTQVFLIDPGQQTGMHQNATYYSYDVHGNVDVLLQDHNTGIMKTSGNRFKKLLYDYDLVSGKVNKVSYQPGLSDAFYHRYVYDAENRVTEVYTSRDNLVWDKDAQYGYYKHGPLQRLLLGNQVQSVDYVYTLQGWLKAVNPTEARVYDGGNCGNGTAGTGPDELVVNQRQANTPAVYAARSAIIFEPGFESGTDDVYETGVSDRLAPCVVAGPGGSTPAPDLSDGTTAGPLVPRDVYGYTLSYYGAADYKGIRAGSPSAAIPGQLTGYQPLYNGNIAAMGVRLPQTGSFTAPPMVYRYGYDQLNRLTAMDAWRSAGTAFGSLQATTDYRERVSYDANGNILTYDRNGAAAAGGTAMDALTYQYAKDASGNLTGNRLRYVHDNVNSAYTEDIDSQTPLSLSSVQAERSGEQATDNYRYDAIGNLVQDAQEGIQSITWNVYGKISNISKNNRTSISYLYDATGNRVSKTYQGKETVYVRDASGNVMSVYVAGDGQLNGGRLTQTEAHIYGSSRLGMVQLTTDMQPPLVISGPEISDGNPIATGPVPVTGLSRGSKVYELTNHLGNVLATIADRKVGKDIDNDGQVDYYEAVVVSASDYYPFGMGMPGRKWSSGSYRYGFNGKENDNEVKGEGNQQDYGMRIYDPRLGKFLSVDPLSKKYPELTPYQFASNTPISAIDLDGLEATISIEKNTYFVVLKNIDFRFVKRKSTEYFTQATKDFPRHDFSINTQMFDYKSSWDYYWAKTPQPYSDYTPQGQNVAHGAVVSGRSADKTFNIAHNKDGSWSTGYGDVPKDATFGIGGGTPIVINGLNFGAENVFTDDAPDRIKKIGAKGWVDPADWKYLKQKSSGVYAGQNDAMVGKTILGFNSKTNVWIIVSQQNGKEGFTLDQIRDRLVGQGYNNVLAFDGSTSSTLVENGKTLVSPDQRKNSTIPSGLNLSVPDK